MTNLKNGIRKNGDAHFYSHQSGESTVYPGCVVEVCYSDAREKWCRDIRLWLEESDLAV